MCVCVHVCMCVLNLNYLQTYLGNNSRWDEFVHLFSKRWSKMISRWAYYGRTHRLHVVYYEDMKTNQLDEVGKLLDFLNVSYNHSELSKRLNEDFSDFHRKHSKDTEFQHYTEEQQLFVEHVIADTEQVLITSRLQNICSVQRYIIANRLIS